MRPVHIGKGGDVVRCPKTCGCFDRLPADPIGREFRLHSRLVELELAWGSEVMEMAGDVLVEVLWFMARKYVGCPNPLILMTDEQFSEFVLANAALMQYEAEFRLVLAEHGLLHPGQ